MSRAALLGSLVLLLVLVGLASLHGSLLALSMPLLVFLFYGLWRAPEGMRLEVQRKLSADRVAPHMPVTVTVTAMNRGQGVEELAVLDMLSKGLTIIDGNNHHLISLARGATFTFEYSVKGPRGGYPFENVHAEGGDALGMLYLGKESAAFGELFVLPDVMRIRQVPILPRRTRVYAGLIPARVGGAGVEFFGLRNYEPGDPPRRINWRASARHSEELYSNEFQQERVADVAIVLDGRERSNLSAGGHSLFEHSVVAAGALADSLLAQGNRVGLLVYGDFLQWTMPGYGKLQRQRIFHALSGASTGASQIFDGLQYLPTRVFPTESQIVLVSPLVEDDYSTLIQLRARGYQILLVVPDPVSFEVSHSSVLSRAFSAAHVSLAARVIRMERELMLGRLRRAGLQVVEWDVAQPFDQAMRRAVGRRMQGAHRR